MKRSSRKMPKADAPGLDEFWAAYPRKVKRKPARAIWNKLAPDEALRVRILEAIERQKQPGQWRRGCIEPPTTWLNQELWENEVHEERPSNQQRTNSLEFDPRQAAICDDEADQ